MDARRPVSDILLERYVLGEVSPAERAALDARLATDPSFAGAVETIKKSTQEILSALPPAATADAIRSRYETAIRGASASHVGPRLRLVWASAVALVAGTVAAVVVFQELESKRGTGTVVPEVTRAKGDGSVPHLIVRRVGRDATDVLQDGAAAKAGETLQLSYVGKGARFGAIVSVDGSGRVTVHLPMDGTEAAPLDPKTETALPRSFELDAAPRFERFFFVNSESPFKVETVTAAASALAREIDKAATAPLSLPDGLSQASFSLRKVTP